MGDLFCPVHISGLLHIVGNLKCIWNRIKYATEKPQLRKDNSLDKTTLLSKHWDKKDRVILKIHAREKQQ